MEIWSLSVQLLSSDVLSWYLLSIELVIPLSNDDSRKGAACMQLNCELCFHSGKVIHLYFSRILAYLFHSRFGSSCKKTYCIVIKPYGYLLRDHQTIGETGFINGLLIKRIFKKINFLFKNFWFSNSSILQIIECVIGKFLCLIQVIGSWSIIFFSSWCFFLESKKWSKTAQKRRDISIHCPRASHTDGTNGDEKFKSE